MKKILSLFFLFLIVSITTRAQTKVFKEVGEEISSQIKAIIQDGALAGYLVFTQLEKVSADSFNYKITIMDENLNDIGSVNFRETNLSLAGVALEQDVICLAYLKSNVLGVEYKDRRECSDAAYSAGSFLFTQTLSLTGKILNTNSIPAQILYSPRAVAISARKVIWKASGKLQQDIQLRNIAGRGFVCFYGDEIKNNLVIFNTSGKLSWQRPVKEDAKGYLLMTSGMDVYLLIKQKDRMMEGGFELLGFNIKDTAVYPKYVLKDPKGNSLKVLAFDNDPVTGKPYLSGTIIDPRKGNKLFAPRDYANGVYSGVFTINLNSHKKGGFNEEYSYWADGSMPFMSKKGMIVDKDAYMRYRLSFRDYHGNTYFTGSSFVRQPRWGGIVVGVIFAPLIFPPLITFTHGHASKYTIKDPMLLRQDTKGALSYDNSMSDNKSLTSISHHPIGFFERRDFYKVTNPDTKTDYVIVDDDRDIVIYNVSQKKVLRTIPHKDKDILTVVYPAKEGHVLVSEFNRKEKYTRFSIEAL